MTESGPGVSSPKVGLTLPSFQTEPERVLAVAKAAEDAGLDGVFAFDHLFRQRGDVAGAARRPALELLTMTAAVAATTRRIMVGTLVARATLRSPGLHRAAFDTLARIAPGRIIAGLGAGDDESLMEDLAFGVLGEEEDAGAVRVARLEATVDALAGGAYPVWVAGSSPAALRVAVTADGWNSWGATPARFTVAAGRVRAALAEAGRDAGGFTLTWGGLTVLGATPDEARAKSARLGGDRPGVVTGTPSEVAGRIAAYAAAGAAWVILGPVDSSDPSNAALLGQAAAQCRSS